MRTERFRRILEILGSIDPNRFAFEKQHIEKRERRIDERCQGCPYPRHGIVCWHWRSATRSRRTASVDELNALDGKRTARQLIDSGSGTITPYGVVYDNGMKLEQVYDGRFLPCYYYEPNAITVAVTSKAEPEDTEHITWLFLPMIQEEIDRALQRAGGTDQKPCGKP